MNLKEQLYVCTLARCKNISRASEELFISQPALSIYINNLENFLGVKLFDRKDKKFILTYMGELYVEKANKMIQLKMEFDDELSAFKNNTSGRIRIGVQSRRVTHLLAPIVADFKKLYPNVKLVFYDATHQELEQLYDEDKLDLLLCMSYDFKENSEHRLIYSEKILVALHPDHPANAYGKEIEGERYKRLDLKHLDGEHFILQHTYQSIRKTCEKALMSANSKPGSIDYIGNMECCMQMVAEGLGVGFNREYYAKYMNYLKPVNYYTFGDESCCADFMIVYKKELPMTDYVKVMMDIIISRGNEQTL